MAKKPLEMFTRREGNKGNFVKGSMEMPTKGFSARKTKVGRGIDAANKKSAKGKSVYK